MYDVRAHGEGEGVSPKADNGTDRLRDHERDWERVSRTSHVNGPIASKRRRLLIVPKRLQSHGKIAENNPHLAIAKTQDAVAAAAACWPLLREEPC